MISKVNDMTSGSPAKQIFLFSLPLMLGNILQQGYIMIDSMIVGRFIGVEALAAIGAADWLNWMVLGTVIGFCHGFSILISQYFGAEDYNSLRKAVTMSILLGAVIAVVFTAVFLPSARGALILLNTPSNILEDSLAFLRIMFAGIAVITAYNTLSSILRALGDSRTPLVATAIASVINIVLDLIFVLVLHWGVAGAAAATVTAQVFSCIFCLKAVRNIAVLKFSRKDWKPDRALIFRLIKLGAPLAFQNAIIGVGGVVVQFVINGFGVIFVAGFTAVMKLYGLLELAATSFGFAVATFTGQNMGARKFTRIRSGLNSALKMAIGTALVISAIVLVFGKQLVNLFISGNADDVNAVIAVAYKYLVIMSCLLFVLYLLHLYRSALQGMGDTVVPMLSGVIELFMRIGSVLVLPLLIGMWGVYLAEVIAWLGAELLLMITYYARMKKFYVEEGISPESIKQTNS